MSDAAQALRDFEAEHEFFVGIDSDGCAFDTMGIKQRECSDSEEARGIAGSYADIIQTIEQQSEIRD